LSGRFFSITILRVSCSISVCRFNQGKRIYLVLRRKTIADGDALCIGASVSTEEIPTCRPSGRNAGTAAILSIRPETVKTRLHRARRLLRKNLDDKLSTVLRDTFPFQGARCARITQAVMARLGLESAPEEDPENARMTEHSTDLVCRGSAHLRRLADLSARNLLVSDNKIRFPTPLV
jgi:hypothetical protein